MDNFEPLTSVQLVKKTAPQLLADASDDTLNALIADATLQVLADGFPKVVFSTDNQPVPVRELACRYLTLHLATMDTDNVGVSSVKVDVLQETYIDKTSRDWLNSSTWGQMYLRLLAKYASNNLNNRVILH